MVSGRGLGHTGGTLDKLESIPGFRVDLSVAQYRDQLQRIGLSLIGQTSELAPADRKLYALRDVTGTVESIPLISSSIMSKKIAEGTQALVLDVKVGRGAFIKSLDRARELASTMVGLGRSHGVATIAQLTAMNQPLGRAVGNALEVTESIDVLRGAGPEDVRELTLSLARTMLELVNIDVDPATKLDDGSAYEVYCRMIEAQGRVGRGGRRVAPGSGTRAQGGSRLGGCWRDVSRARG
jgi:thymidine phosphorylase